MKYLYELASLVRSKNAGPFHLTFDIFIKNEEVYEKMKEANAINKAIVKHIYGTDKEYINLIEYDEASAFKVTIPRKHSSGSPRDRDMMGGQQHAPLVNLEIDLDDVE